MKRCAAVLALGLLAAGAVAQQSILLPTTAPGTLASNYPFGGPRMRYQQWYSAAEWAATAQNPVRVTGMAFRATTPGGQAGKIVDMEVTMANSDPIQPGGSFDGNLASGRVIVLPRQLITLGSAQPGTFAVNLSFLREFVWDGTSGVVVDIQLHDNGNNDQIWQYDLEYQASAGFRVARLFTIGSPTAMFASVVQTGSGLTTRFTYNEAISYPYGQGCAGAGGHVPTASTSGGFPIPGNAIWQHDLTTAASQRPALFWTGLSDTVWGSNPLPFDLGPIGAPGCLVLADTLAFAPPQVTVGSGAGAGSASFILPVPSRTDFIGTPIYSQWLVLDPLSPNGLLAVSNGVVSVIGSQ